MDPYYQSRYTPNPDRTVVWKEITRFLQPFLAGAATIVDLGAGYCDFINNVSAPERIAIDYSPDSAHFAAPGVRTIQSSVTKLALEDSSANVFFASNLLEHLTDDDLESTMTEIKRVLKTDGLLILMQPNYRFSYKTYFDDPTHKKVFSDEALKTFLISHGFEIRKLMPRFLPFSLKSRPGLVPISAAVVRAYIHSPWKPFAGQMLVVGKLKTIRS
jgi:SAM-dependent methyltransferase